ncbi:tyrosine-type recombinase/integrase [Cupriavidus necator]|uniref:Tyr recombinase domain-containing protein n=1 Tax=Cupriavidus necator TaxID=106590 RepID=A0A367PMU9_CUPNE|nr:tyrosine-type recombinase/integrase [Cupriavidus necator]QQX84791.1 tyrosine-type recombinase/integrase [Cupriavidus necator]RCJ08864.1 hypothetical protein DDK22_08235 [Cupriavidus necator]
MTNGEINCAIETLLSRHRLALLPNHVIDRDGRRMDMTSARWKFNVPTAHATFDWAKHSDGNVIVGYAVRRWAAMLLTQQSGTSVVNALKTVVGALRGRTCDADTGDGALRQHWELLSSIEHADDLQDALRRHLMKSIQVLRARKAMDGFYLLRSWYLWSAEMLECLGFDEEFALDLDDTPVAARYSRLAVELEDEECGPLWDTEVTVLRRALAEDRSPARSHVMQRAAVALSLAYGRNPSNFCLLRETDLSNRLAGFNVPPQWVLSIPRIKKRGQRVRQQFVEERVSDELLVMLQDLLAMNQGIDCGGYPRPLFMRADADAWRAGTGVDEYAYHMTVKEFLWLIRKFATRMAIVSPRTAAELRLSSRRLRYTFATTMVELGVSKTVLATMLDHSDTQHVRVYYALKGRRLTRILDQAAAIRLGPLMKLFKGTPIGTSQAETGKVSPDKKIRFVGDMNAVPPVEIGACGQPRSCSLDPPFSCYLCPKFQPYVEADHQAVLVELIRGREARRSRLGMRLSVQMDDVIYAVAEVVQLVAGYGKRNGKQT